MQSQIYKKITATYFFIFILLASAMAVDTNQQTNIKQSLTQTSTNQQNVPIQTNISQLSPQQIPTSFNVRLQGNEKSFIEVALPILGPIVGVFIGSIITALIPYRIFRLTLQKEREETVRTQLERAACMVFEIRRKMCHGICETTKSDVTTENRNAFNLTLDAFTVGFIINSYYHEANSEVEKFVDKVNKFSESQVNAAGNKKWSDNGKCLTEAAQACDGLIQKIIDKYKVIYK